MELQDFIDEYASKPDDELLRLAIQRDQLTPEAETALTVEMARRRINTPDKLSTARREEEERKAEEERDMGRLFSLPWGIGRDRFGKSELSYDPATRLERFKTTVFVVLLWFPLIPTGTYLVERKRSFWWNEMKVIEKLPLDWEQVLRIWVVAMATLLGVMLFFRLLPRFL